MFNSNALSQFEALHGILDDKINKKEYQMFTLKLRTKALTTLLGVALWLASNHPRSPISGSNLDRFGADNWR